MPTTDTDFRTYWEQLDSDERSRFARKAGTTQGYIQAHLIYARKIPRPKLLHRLAKASNGALTVPSLVEFFYTSDAAQQKVTQLR